ncbi:hypothetical protein WBP07_32610 [Novosphingobium sp. BL-8A]|uniref:hypothetical protein n=1 Tax=Novosphingobium sp. BL-8A TaxID=3127639 RepID=UPI003757A5EC
MPTVQYVESADGSCSLTYEGYDQAPAQAGGGAMYLLRASRPEGRTEIRGTVQSTTGRRAEYQAMREGLNLTAMRSSETRKYREEFSEKFGDSYCVTLFLYADESKDEHNRIIINKETFSELFCNLFLILTADYKYNNPEYPRCGDGHYQVSIDYQPYGVSPDLIRHFTADEAFSRL